ncbi:MAG TPA: hypothetical protein VES20_13980 [Bryobacteraceae bacterium]|nr:hypothetical protein [Bryobacteraceae bacterium]
MNKQTNSVGPDDSEVPGSVIVRERTCVDRDLSLWPDGRIAGPVTNASGTPLNRVTVQAFAFDARGERESRPLRTAQTDAERSSLPI